MLYECCLRFQSPNRHRLWLQKFGYEHLVKSVHYSIEQLSIGAISELLRTALGRRSYDLLVRYHGWCELRVAQTQT